MTEIRTDRHSPASWRRRDVLRTGVRAAAAITAMSTFPAGVRALSHRAAAARMTGANDMAYLADPQRMEELVLNAIDSARHAGARYAEARVSRNVVQWMGDGGLGLDDERFTIGVRALVDGAWGFAASTYWTVDEAAALAKDAVAQARINAAVFPREVDIGSYPVAKGHWVTPIRIDPFQISPEEKRDFFQSFPGRLPRHVSGRQYLVRTINVKLVRQERMVATTEGSLFSQTLYQAGGLMYVQVQADDPVKGKGLASAVARGIGTATAGWELFLDAKLREQIPGLIAEAEANLFLPHKPVDVGRYEVVMPAGVMASFVASTLGNATQLDRAVGMEANAGGTSYLGPDPNDHLGTTLGAPILTVTANRSMPKGLATVKWDDEGVEPETFPLIDKGVFVDYQTTREQASWLAPWYQSRQRPVRSHGCAVAPEALDFPLQHTPNLVVTPGTGAATFDEMIKQTSKGIAFLGGGASTDFQSRTGLAGGTMREIVNGQLGAVLDGAGILFDSKQLWKNLLEIGGPTSVDRVGFNSGKGQPSQGSGYSVEAAAARFKDMTVIDQERR